jgi:hypothetical protein
MSKNVVGSFAITAGVLGLIEWGWLEAAVLAAAGAAFGLWVVRQDRMFRQTQIGGRERPRSPICFFLAIRGARACREVCHCTSRSLVGPDPRLSQSRSGIGPERVATTSEVVSDEQGRH